LLILILFKDFRNQHYREFIGNVGDMDGVQQILDLSVVPTIQKFFCRIKTLRDDFLENHHFSFFSCFFLIFCREFTGNYGGNVLPS